MSDSDSAIFFFVNATTGTSPTPTIQLPHANVAGKILFMVGNYTASGTDYFLRPQGTDVLHNVLGAKKTSAQSEVVGFYCVLISDGAGAWHVLREN